MEIFNTKLILEINNAIDLMIPKRIYMRGKTAKINKLLQNRLGIYQNSHNYIYGSGKPFVSPGDHLKPNKKQGRIRFSMEDKRLKA
mmetsp:Transcript_20642/g.18289  ORF Transcript_20642/g.18289 Transcript_20642/m.18289 type:complete len:86 (+) Transcript_20642:421-678(+)